MKKTEHVHACFSCKGTDLLVYVVDYDDDEENTFARIECTDCGAWGPSHQDEDRDEAIMLAIASWNTLTRRRSTAQNSEGLRSCPFCSWKSVELEEFDEFWWEVSCSCGVRAISSGDQSDLSDEARARHIADLKAEWNRPVGKRPMTTVEKP